MKLVVTSDWHLDHVTHGIARHVELAKLVGKVVERTIEEQADAFLFLGDLCNPDAGSSVFRCVEVALSAATWLAARHVPSIWLAGNHDVIEDGTGDTTLSPLRGLGDGLVHVIERPGFVQVCGRTGTPKTVMCLPFTATSHPYIVEDFVKTAPAERENVVSISHLNVPGVIPGEETTEMPRGREVILPTELVRERAKFVLNGHYHRQQRTLSGVWIPGSLARLTFCEEAHEPGFLVLEV